MSISSKLRMEGKDYDAPGYSFVTLCADERRRIFGRLVGEAIELSDVGQAAEACWHAIPEHFPDVELGAFVVMPDHVHGIVRITRWQRPKGVLADQIEGRKKTGTRRGSLGSIIKGFKIGVTKACQAKTPFGHPVFQANYYDVICFDAAELAIKEAYIRANPQRLALKKVPRGTIKRSAYLGNLGHADGHARSSACQMVSRLPPLPRALAVALSRGHDRRHARKLPRLQRVGKAPRQTPPTSNHSLTALLPNL